jgi:cell shape-determining protein MreC
MSDLLLIKDINEAAKFLDEVKPGWALEINVEKLDMADGNNCILAQLYNRSYISGISALSLSAHNQSAFGPFASKTRWIEEIKQRTNTPYNPVADAIANMREDLNKANKELEETKAQLAKVKEMQLEKNELNLIYEMLHESFPDISEHLRLKRKLQDLYMVV